MRNTVAGRVAGTLAAFALVVSLSFGGALNAQAQTAEELQAQIAQLTALIAQLQAQIAGGTTSTPAGLEGYVFTRNLTPGSTGADVTMLQKFLNANGAPVATVGAGSPGNETAFYGPATGAAVKVYQEAHRAEILAPLGLTVGTVNFGSSTRAYVNAQLASGTPTTPTTPGTGSGDLSGGEGYMEAYEFSVNTDVDTGETEVVYEFEVEAFDSDIAVNRVDFLFDDRPWLIFDEVVLLADGREVGSLSRDRDYTRTGSDWRARFAGLDVVVEEGDVVEFALEVTAVSALRGGAASADLDVWVPVNGIRGVDAVGLVQYAPTSAALASVNAKVVDNFGEGSLSVRNNNTPKATTFSADDSDPVVLAFGLEAKDSDINVESVSLDVTDGNKVLRRLSIMDGSTTLASQRIDGTDSYEFDLGRRGLDIRSGRTANLEVVAEFDNDVSGNFTVTFDNDAYDNGVTPNSDPAYREGAVIYTNADYVEGYAKGSMGSGVTHTFAGEGAASVVQLGEGFRAVDGSTPGYIEVEFRVTAGDDDVTIDSLVSAATAATGELVYGVDGTSGTVTAQLLDRTGRVIDLSTAEVVARGTSEEYTLVVSFTAQSGTIVFLEIEEIDGISVTEVYHSGR